MGGKGVSDVASVGVRPQKERGIREIDIDKERYRYR